MKTTPENWLPIPGYQDRYLISDRGNVKKVLANGSVMPVNVRLDRAGYLTVRLYNNRQALTKFVHRLVATAFVQNEKGKPFVNHKNGIKQDNQAANLEWVTHAENVQHAYENGLISRERKVKAIIDIATGKSYRSIKEAAHYTGIPYSTCKNYLNGNRPNITFLRYAEKGAA